MKVLPHSTTTTLFLGLTGCVVYITWISPRVRVPRKSLSLSARLTVWSNLQCRQSKILSVSSMWPKTSVYSAWPSRTWPSNFQIHGSPWGNQHVKCTMWPTQLIYFMVLIFVRKVIYRRKLHLCWGQIFLLLDQNIHAFERFGWRCANKNTLLGWAWSMQRGNMHWGRCAWCYVIPSLETQGAKIS